jgi:hypothetical protein
VLLKLFKFCKVVHRCLNMFVELVEYFSYRNVCGLQIYLMPFVGVHLQINEFTKDCLTH